MAWRRGQAYGQDLRDRVLAAAGSVSAVAQHFGVSHSYVSKARARLRCHGDSAPGAQRNHVAPKLAALHEPLRAQVAQAPDATLAELRAWAAHEHGVSVSHAAMWRTLVRLRLPLKKSRCTRPSKRAPT